MAYSLVFSFLGGIFLIIFQPILSKLNQNLSLSGRAWERIQDERITAYKALLKIAGNMSTTVPTGKHHQGHVETIPVYLADRESFENFIQLLNQSLVDVDDWVDHSTRQHCRYITDYFWNLQTAVIKSNEVQFLELGLVAKQDLIGLASETRTVAHKFFERINRRSFRSLGNGKYPLKKTHNLLNKTKLNPWMAENQLLSKEGEEMPNFYEY